MLEADTTGQVLSACYVPGTGLGTLWLPSEELKENNKIINGYEVGV